MILLIGAGKLGQLIISQFDSHEIIGSKTSAQPGFIQLNLKTKDLSTLDYETFIFCVPPSALDTELWLKRLSEIKTKKIIFISSTGIYGENIGIVTEDIIPQPSTENGHKLFIIEKALHTFDKAFILRPSGLFSKDSHPGKYLAGKEHIKNGLDPVNLVAREDVAKVVKKLYSLESPRLLNLTNPNHPIKSSYYKDYCQSHNLPLPKFNLEHGSNKLIQSNFNLLDKFVELP